MTKSDLRWERRPAAGALAQPAHAADWDRLNLERGNLPFLAARAVNAALDVFGAGNEELLIGRSGKDIAAMFVVRRHRSLGWSTFQPSQMPLGAWVAESRRPLTELAGSLLRGPLGLCLVLSITQVDPRFAPREADGPGRHSDDYVETAWIELTGSFEAYWNTRGKNLRQNMRKQRNRLAADGVSPRMQTFREAVDIAPALGRYGALESAGWKAARGTAIGSENAQGRFYRRLLEEAAAAGEAAIYEYLFDTRTVAMNLCLLRDEQLIVLKTAYDESFKSLSPAFLLREEELQSFFAGNDVRRVEYYGRLMDWHTKLTENRRTLYHLTCYRWNWLKKVLLRRRAKRATRSAQVISAPTLPASSPARDG